ncbi:MAG TPA: hypothetical protein VGO06_06280 [Bosea sp. (in: a-proteobacteria)]|uniref:hypothetical protein n=1 Tax=Bosea sp. (in: a-proteobacteria) TaxID=1871050 RepID=UPI002E122F19|nr:hypothetical protein [Bosea sp. (in: a-proteobacteria)]
MIKSTSEICENQPVKRPPRRNMLRRKRLATTETSIRFRESGTRAARLPSAENTRIHIGLRETQPDTSSCAASVTNPPSLPLSSSSSKPSISLHSIRLTLQAYRVWREKNRSVITHLKRREAIGKNRERAGRRLSPHWTKAKEIDRAPAYMAAILETGMATAFTLNFSPDVLRAAEKAKEGTFHNLRSRITRELKKALGDSPALVCALDKTASGRWHIHGALALHPSQRDLAVAALRRAGGKWAKGRGQRHQLHMQADQWALIDEDFSDVQQPLDTGWAGYCTKIASRLRKETNHSVLYASQEIKRKAEIIYTRNRTAKRANSSINTDLTQSYSDEIAIANESAFSENTPVINQKQAPLNEYADSRAGRLRRNPGGYAASHLQGRNDLRHHPCRRSGELHADLRHDRARRLSRARAGPLRAGAGRDHRAHGWPSRRAGARRRPDAQVLSSRHARGCLMTRQPEPRPAVDLNFKVSPVLRQRLKIEAAKRNVSMKELLEVALRAYLDAYPAPERDERF